MKNKMAMITTLALGAAMTLTAQDAAPRGGGQGFGPHGLRGGRGPMGPPPALVVIDEDQDRILSEAEINNAVARLLTLDANQDGQLVFEELCPRPPRPEGTEPGAGRPVPPPPGAQGKGKRFGGGKGPMGPPPVMHALDSDGDRVLSAAEIQHAPTALLKLDANADKELSPEELRPQGGPDPKECPQGVPPASEQ
jgi:hypothetical protein